MRLLVTGSREPSDPGYVRAALLLVASFHHPNVTLVHGGARGVDTLAGEVANEKQWKVEPHPVTPEDFSLHGKRAYFLRNKKMVDLGADLCFAFPQGASPGTRMTIRLAEEAGIDTRVFELQ